MLEQHVPEDLRGDWIWLSQPHSETNKYCFFRHDVTLDQTPREAEFLIAANSTFHLFINGRHIYFGESSLNRNKTYVHSIDVSYCLHPGNNIISISVYNSDHTQFNQFSHDEGGIWADLRINKLSKLTTGKEWFVRSADCLYSCNLAKTSRYGFTEKIDFNKVVQSWLHSSDFEKENWVHPDIVKPISEYRRYFAPTMVTNVFCSETVFKKAVAHGSIRRHDYTTCVDYSEIMGRNGTYVSEGYFYADSPGPVDYALYCDTPYKMFLNDQLLRENAVNKTVNGAINNETNYLIDFDTPNNTMKILEGWNKICIVQQLKDSAYGFTLNIDADPIQFNILRTYESDSLPGWSMAGPIKTPLDLSNGQMLFAQEDFTSFYSIEPIDESAYHKSLRYVPSPEVPDIRLERFSIKPLEYIVLDLGQVHYALPQLSIEGTEGDIVDVFCSSRMEKSGYLPAFEAGRSRTADSVILSGKKDRWINFHPRGFRYLMIVARKVTNKITISKINAKTISRDFTEEGFFESSDKLLNLIWQHSCNTVEANVNFRILDGAGREHTQYISDSLIQSRVGFLSRGDFQSSEKALREFMAGCYETGQMPSMHPSEIPCHLLDLSLMFMEWLRHHYIYTNDTSLIEEFKPYIYKYLTYLRSLQVPDEDVIYIEPNNHEYFLDLRMPEIHGVTVPINALYARALLNASTILNAVGDDKYAVKLQEKAQRISKVISRLCWNEETNSFADYWYDDKLSETESWQSNILAIYGGIATEEQTQVILNQLFSEKTPFANFIDKGYFTPYFMYFVLEVLSGEGEIELLTNIIRYFWGGIIGAGDGNTWPEMFAPRNRENPLIGGNLCMGYSTGPAIHLIQNVVGITPAEPGYNKVYFSPAIELVDNIKAQVPTIEGAIMVTWYRNEETGSLVIELDANHPVELIPIFSSENNIEIEFHISDIITIVEE